MSMQQFTEGNKIIVPIEVRLSDLDQIQDALGVLRDTQDAANLLEAEGFGEKKEKGFGASDITQMAGLARDPAGFILNLIRSNPYIAAAFAAAIGAHMGYEWMTERGRPWSLFFKRVLDKEANVGRSRQSRQAILAGFEQTIFVSRSGESKVEEAFNSYEQVRNKEIKDMQIYHIRSGAPP